MLTGIVPRTSTQRDLFAQADHPRDHTLMETVDAINRQWGQGTIFFAASGTKRSWAMRQVRRSPSYTTRWAEIPVVL